MIKNNIEVDVKIKCIETGMTQAQLGESIGSTGWYVNSIAKIGFCNEQALRFYVGSFGL